MLGDSKWTGKPMLYGFLRSNNRRAGEARERSHVICFSGLVDGGGLFTPTGPADRTARIRPGRAEATGFRGGARTTIGNNRHATS